MGCLANLKEKRTVKKLIKSYLLPLDKNPHKAKNKEFIAFSKLLQMAENPNRKTLIRRTLRKAKVLIDKELGSLNPNVDPEVVIYKDRRGRTRKRITKLAIGASFLAGFLVPGSLPKMVAGGLTVQLFHLLNTLNKNYEEYIMPRYLRKKLSKNINSTFEEIIGFMNTPTGLFDYLDPTKLRNGLEEKKPNTEASVPDTTEKTSEKTLEDEDEEGNACETITNEKEHKNAKKEKNNVKQIKHPNLSPI